MEFLSYLSKHFDSGPFFYKHWNSYLILPHVRILVLFLETLGSFPCPSKHWNCGPIFLTLEFLPYFNAHCNFDVILWNTETLTIFLQSLQFLTCPSTAITGILTPSFQTLEIQPYLYTHWNSYLILPNVWILAPFYKHWNFDRIPSHFGILALFFTDWNFQLILPSIWVLALFLQTLEFLSYPFTGNIKIVALSFQTVELWPNIYIHWFSDLNLQNIGILALFL